MIQLTDEERLVDNLPMEEVGYDYGKAVAKAQLKKVLKEAKAKDISNTFRLALLEEVSDALE